MAALRAQLEWGADEALELAPRVRLDQPRPEPARPAAVVVAPAAMRPAAPGILGPVMLTPGILAPGRRAMELAAGAGDLAQLRAALAGFDGCALAATATNLVFTDGDPAAGLVLIGEGPGAEEDQQGRPFVGASGRLLDKMLASIGLDRTKCLITNVIFWRPPGNRTPTDSEVALCLPFMLRLLALTRPRHVVTLGKLATAALSGQNDGIRRLRGRWLPVAAPGAGELGVAEGLTALAMLHPAYLLRTPSARREAWSDMLTLREALEAGATKPDKEASNG